MEDKSKSPLQKLLKEKKIKIELHYQALKLCLIKGKFVSFLLKTYEFFFIKEILTCQTD